MSDFASDAAMVTFCRSVQGLNCRFGLPVKDDFVSRVQAVIAASKWDAFLRGALQGPIRQHHAFRIAISGCPNGCARPHIADVGIIRVCRPQVDEALCSSCGRCATACPDEAITMQSSIPQFDTALCIDCGQCPKRCPEKALSCMHSGYKVVMGGQLGRHPALAEQVGDIHSDDAVLSMLTRALEFYMKHYKSGLRFGALMRKKRQEFERYVQQDNK